MIIKTNSQNQATTTKKKIHFVIIHYNLPNWIWNLKSVQVRKKPVCYVIRKIFKIKSSSMREKKRKFIFSSNMCVLYLAWIILHFCSTNNLLTTIQTNNFSSFIYSFSFCICKFLKRNWNSSTKNKQKNIDNEKTKMQKTKFLNVFKFKMTFENFGESFQGIFQTEKTSLHLYLLQNHKKHWRF